MITEPQDSKADNVVPEHTFLTAQQVIARYGWGRTKGYRMLRSDDFPRPIGGDRYRLDVLMEWEGRQQSGGAPPRPFPVLPPPKRRPARGRSSVAVEALSHVR